MLAVFSTASSVIGEPAGVEARPPTRGHPEDAVDSQCECTWQCESAWLSSE